MKSYLFVIISSIVTIAIAVGLTNNVASKPEIKPETFMFNSEDKNFKTSVFLSKNIDLESCSSGEVVKQCDFSK